MKITAIKQQVKQQGRYSIFVEGKYSFSLSDVALLDSKLIRGQELTEQEVRNFQKSSVDDKLYNQALRYIALRSRSKWEIETYLKRKSSDYLLQQEIVNKLTDIGFVNDEAFAEAWVANRRLLKSVSRRHLLQELRAKHIADDIAQQVLAEDETDELQTLRELVNRKRQQTRYQDELKLMQYLARQGFQYDDIKSVLHEEKD
jgi:regulatory protein